MHKTNFLENFTETRDIKWIHFVGIGGISMSGLAEIMMNQGYTVSGSDMHRSGITDSLASKGITVFSEQHERNIDPRIDLIVHTAAVSSDNPEMREGSRLGIRIVDRAYLLGMMMKGYRYPISAAGTHGKTTTTSMLAEIFMAADLDPTVSLGGVLNTIGGNYRLGNSEYCIVEGDEYFDSFLKFFPYVGIILNIDSDHLDYFGSMENIESSFNRFAQNIDPEGALIIHAMPGLERITEGVKCRIITYGGGSSMYQAADIGYSGSDEDSSISFNIVENGQTLCRVSMRVPGLHNVDNALAACAAARVMGVPLEGIVRGLERFTGAKRRFEIKGRFGGVMVMDDYAHHPTEITAALAAARRAYADVADGSDVPRRRIICVFQPHNYSRTSAYLKEFGESFGDADMIVVLDIYSVREKNTYNVHASQLMELLVNNGKNAYYFPDFESAKKFLFDECINGDLLITMGAGDVYLLGESMLRTDLSTLSTGE